MKPPVSPWRWMRAWVLGGSAVTLSSAGHLIGGGRVEPVLLLLLAASASLAAYGWLRTERGLPAILVAVAVIQMAAHVTLGAGHTHGSSSAMTAGHVVAAILLAGLLRHGEARLFATARRRYLRWLVAVRTAVAGVPLARRAVAAMPGSPAVLTTNWIHRAVHGRAPPVAAFC